MQAGVENAKRNKKNWDKLVEGELEEKEDASDPVRLVPSQPLYMEVLTRRMPVVMVPCKSSFPQSIPVPMRIPSGP